ncbi:hypothetical protein E2C01_086179 [Portunus trituberculatus]|uniref:Uncharacterized protein n=1 Tax=Portunus trituberculatus TaxID=210409 RepID=A0A5B7J338_PORTR|nr:hypothetical protein [Portunus trituberculatus]
MFAVRSGFFIQINQSTNPSPSHQRVPSICSSLNKDTTCGAQICGPFLKVRDPHPVSGGPLCVY